ncbi:MAG TPA: branched-chain amino acid ABC transporter permease [Acidimicrobiales bacterium]|jgi:branched-chain amino acid transport system permease protein|nr:branched-chain amino acid ABC transporter permease [Acidimicrobiales bacterium]
MDWVNAVVQGILLGGVFALFATGLSLSFGIMRLANLAHGTLALLAAFMAYSIVDATGVNPLVALLAVVPIMFVVGYVLQRGLLNFTLSGDPLTAILVTFGLAIVIENLLLERYSADARGLDAGSIESESIRVTDDIAIGWFPLMTLAVAVGVLALLYLVFARTRAGRAFRAISDDRATGRLVGIDERHYFALAMGIALATVAIAGVFLGIRTTFSPADGNAQLLFGFEAVIIGGLGSLWGTLAGGVVLGVAQTVGAQIEPGWSVLTGHLVFLAVLAVRPNGLFGKATPA